MDKDIEFCFLLSQTTKQSLTKKQAPKVFFLSSTFPIQLTSKYPSITKLQMNQNDTIAHNVKSH